MLRLTMTLLSLMNTAPMWWWLSSRAAKSD
jgi:hypothetical protein